MIVSIHFESSKHDEDFVLEKLKNEELKIMEICVICLEEFSDALMFIMKIALFNG